MPNEFEDTDTEVFEVIPVAVVPESKPTLGPEFDGTCQIVSVAGDKITLKVIPPESAVCSVSTSANHIASDVVLALGLLDVECGGLTKDGDKWVLPITGKLPPSELS
jgi:hypothetical protein